ncbi:hypothetical protein NKH77_33190 [Streptomyces sp. M19]
MAAGNRGERRDPRGATPADRAAARTHLRTARRATADGAYGDARTRSGRRARHRTRQRGRRAVRTCRRRRARPRTPFAGRRARGCRTASTAGRSAPGDDDGGDRYARVDTARRDESGAHPHANGRRFPGKPGKRRPI